MASRMAHTVVTVVRRPAGATSAALHYPSSITTHPLPLIQPGSDHLDAMPLDSTRHAHVINLMLRNGQPARILFKTNQRVAGAGQPRWRMVICGDRGTVG